MSADQYENTKLEKYGKETVLQFIQKTIKNSNDVKKDILDKITYVTDEVSDGTTSEDRSSQGFYYERLWDLCIKFGVTPLTLPSLNSQLQTSHVIRENPNSTAIRFQTNCWNGAVFDEYLREPVRSGSSSGYSDITFINKELGSLDPLEEVFFISVKYFMNEKEISKYDIGKLCSLLKKHESEGRIIKLYIFVKDKEKALEKFGRQKSSSNILIQYINPHGNYEHVLDIHNLQTSFFHLKKVLKQYNYFENSSDIVQFQTQYLRVLKKVFMPRFHQKLCILKINELIDEGEKNVLVGAIPRSGKSFVMAGTILEYIKRSEEENPDKKIKILLITPAPNETFGEYRDIFDNYSDFENIVVDVHQGANLKIPFNKDAHQLIVISKQKLGWSAGSKAEKLLAADDSEEVADEDEPETEEENKDTTRIRTRISQLFTSNPDINIMFLDEAHFGMSTEKAQQIVSTLNSITEDTAKVYVTATYNKPLEAYGVKPRCKLTWDINDIKIMQELTEATMEDNPIRTRFGSRIYSKALDYYKDGMDESILERFQSEYKRYPKPYLITSVWDKEFLNVDKLKIGETEFGWDMNKLFATVGESDRFANEEQMKEMMRYYFGTPDKKQNYAEQSFYRTRGILPRIKNICVNTCRTLQPRHKTSQLWFLPLGTGKIKNKAKAILQLLTQTNEFKDIQKTHHFFVAVDIEDTRKRGRTIGNITYMNDPHRIKKDIEAVEQDMKNGTLRQDHLIILAGQRLQLGISLKNVDIVTLWNSISSSDAIFQMLFRSMTEVVDVPPCVLDEYEYCGEKKFGFMVDMNPQRAIANVSLFSENISRKDSTDDIQKYRQITDLVNIDEDVLNDKYGPEEKDQFVADLFNKLYESWNLTKEEMKRNLRNLVFDQDKLKQLQSTLTKINVDKGQKGDSSPVMTPDAVFEPGANKAKIGKTGAPKKKREKGEEINLQEHAVELIGQFITLLNIFTLYTDNGSRCILSDRLKENTKISVMNDIEQLKAEVYKNEAMKTDFLRILNGRLNGNTNNLFPESDIDVVIDALMPADKHFINKMVMAQKKQFYNIHEPDKLLEFINGELKPKEKEKKENGEVFTPLPLVNEMMDRLDEAYIKEHGRGIFTVKELKWLDPAVGIGNFPIIVYQRLMVGLVDEIRNEEERRKWILEEMIYASELSAKNVFVYKKIFCGDNYDLNIYEGDTLKMDIRDGFVPEDFSGFDVIMGNPPYNKGGIRSHTGDMLGDKNETIWTKFIEKSFEWLKPDGFLAFINPLSWLKKSHSLHNEMLEKHIVWLKLWDNIKSLATINGKIPISLFILQNTPNTTNKKTDIISEIQSKKLTTTSTEYLNPKYSIPLAFHSIFSKVIEFIETRELQLEYKTKTIKSSGTKTKIPTEYTLEDMWAVDTYTIKEGLMVKKATEQHPDANKRKLIISNKASFTGAFIDEGKLSLTGNHKFYILGDNLELVKKMLDFKIINIIGHYTKYGQDFLDNEAFKYLPDIRKLGMEDITEDEFYKLIGLTRQEMNQINGVSSMDEGVEESPILSKSLKKHRKISAKKTSKKRSPTSPSPSSTRKIESRKKTAKKRPKDSADKLYNPATLRFVNNTAANRKKIKDIENYVLSQL
jgi:hypothetical protein